ncbi:MAG: DUF58 domain-containing protein [Planctomycetota bacterium]|jgi:uncharacterized protein (DUF58 family)
MATELKARSIVEGFMMGLNKSPLKGASVDFKQHREYVHGDDLRHLDWKVWGRSDRNMIKEYEQETNARVHIVLDASRSMKYGSGKETKFDYAAVCVASLAYLALQQRDWATFTLFANDLIQQVPGSTSRAHVGNILATVYQTTPDRETNLASSMLLLSEKIQRRGMVILVSDFFDEPERIRKALGYLKAKRHDVIMLHVLDEYELTFPFRQLTMFQGIEEAQLRRLTDPWAIREEYLAALNRFLTEIQRGCLNFGIDYVRLGTNQKIEEALTAYLARRARMVR